MWTISLQIVSKSSSFQRGITSCLVLTSNWQTSSWVSRQWPVVVHYGMRHATGAIHACVVCREPDEPCEVRFLTSAREGNRRRLELASIPCGGTVNRSILQGRPWADNAFCSTVTRTNQLHR